MSDTCPTCGEYLELDDGPAAVGPTSLAVTALPGRAVCPNGHDPRPRDDDATPS